MSSGDTPGRRISLYFPALRYTGHEETDVRGFAAESLPFQATGLDDEAWLDYCPMWLAGDENHAGRAFAAESERIELWTGLHSQATPADSK